MFRSVLRIPFRSQLFFKTSRHFTSLPDHTVIKMPSLSPTMESGTINNWILSEGDVIEEGSVICEINTDKAVVDYEAVDEGFLAKIIQAANSETEIPVGEPIGILVEEEEDIVHFTNYEVADDNNGVSETEIEDKHSLKNTTKKIVKISPELSGTIRASPAARFHAEQREIDLRSIIPSDGKIIRKHDIMDHKTNDLENHDSKTMNFNRSFQTTPHTMMRKTIAQRLCQSKQTAPHFNLSIEVDVSTVKSLRDGFSFNDYFIKASSQALMDVPIVNSQWYDDELVSYNYADISVAISLPTGLITPIIKNAESKRLVEIASETRDLVERAKENKLVPSDYIGGTFSISNLGGPQYQIDNFTAIINPPQSAILAIGRIKENNHATVTLCCDHRVIDGSVGAEWLQRWKEYVENPLKLL